MMPFSSAGAIAGDRPVRGLVLLRHDPHRPKNSPTDLHAVRLALEARRIEVDKAHSCSLARLLRR
jgi:hypothetical protein